MAPPRLPFAVAPRIASGAIAVALMGSLGLASLVQGQGDAPSGESKPALPDRLAAATENSSSRPGGRPASPVVRATREPIEEAKEAIASCRANFAKVRDYSFTFYKRERVDGRLTSMHSMQMKIRNRPLSVYAKFKHPNAGREAIYVAGKHSGKAVVHDVGLGKLIAGTMKLDPNGATAMEDCRHPITEAGIGHMIDTIAVAWDKELSTGESLVVFHRGAKVAERPCTMIETTHPGKQSGFLFHKVKVYIDRELNIPIRFEAYDWPRDGQSPELVEEYTYTNLKLNVGLKDSDFDPANSSYSFGRF